MVLAAGGGLKTAGAKQPLEDTGRAMFLRHCGACHGEHGEGFRALYPPLIASRFLDDDLEKLPCIMRHGLRGEIQVGGQTFNQIMPGNRQLSVHDMDAIIDYMVRSWGANARERDVAHWLRLCD